MVKIQNVTAEIKYGTILLMTPTAMENATVARAAPLALVARGTLLSDRPSCTVVSFPEDGLVASRSHVAQWLH